MVRKRRKPDFSGLPSFAEGPLLMLELYLDESESGRTRPLLVIAGYLADAEKWKDFSEEWTRVLEDRKLTHFHAKELRSGNAKLYRHLSSTERRTLVVDLARLTVKYSLLGVGSIICLPDYKAATSQRFRHKHGSAYGLCIDTLLLMLSDVLIKTGEPERVGVYIEDGHRNAGEAQLRVDHYKRRTEPIEWPEGTQVIIPAPKTLREDFVRIGERALVSKQRVKPVHAADLLAYLIGTKRSSGPDADLFDGIGDMLVKGRPHLFRVWTPALISEFAKNLEQSDAGASEHNQKLHRLRRILGSYSVKTEKFPQGYIHDVSNLSEEEWEEAKQRLQAAEKIMSETGRR